MLLPDCQIPPGGSDLSIRTEPGTAIFSIGGNLGYSKRFIPNNQQESSDQQLKKKQVSSRNLFFSWKSVL